MTTVKRKPIPNCLKNLKAFPFFSLNHSSNHEKVGSKAFLLSEKNGAKAST